MRRRAFLASAGLAALAGCSNGGESGSTATPTSTPTGTGSPEFEFRTVEAAESTPLNDPTAFAIVVENTGTGEGTFTSALEQKVGDGEWQTAGELEIPLSAGETGEWHSPRFTLQYLGTIQFRLAAVDETWSMEVVPAEYDFGVRYATPTGLFVNVLGGSFESTYPTTGTETATNESTPTPTAPADDQVWAVMRVDVRNRLEEAQSTPDASTFTLDVDGEERPLRREVASDPYEGGSLAGRTVRQGELVYPVPSDTNVRDLRMTWTQSYDEGDVKVIWTK
ncbi:hypothetical protein ACFR97_11525 [Haloplanus litoreus]|uniref:DUF4352 domain-containing protein n=1 Tax=Haloplanus litoreus TaxID=767515 RepID=A0ABD5ZX15_9EURY